MSKHGLSASWHTKQDNGAVSVTCTITHLMGHKESVTLSAPPDNSGSKNNIQAIGSTVTYLQRYTLFAITGIAAADQDDDGQTAAPAQANRYISDGQKHKIADMLTAVYGNDHSDFLKYIGCDSIDTIPKKDFQRHFAGLTAIYKKRNPQ